MVIQQRGLLAVTPVGPVSWELSAGGLNESRAAHLVESIAEVEFQQSEVGLCVSLKRVSKVVCDNLDAPGATNSVVEPFEVGTFLAPKPKHFAVNRPPRSKEGELQYPSFAGRWTLRQQERASRKQAPHRWRVGSRQQPEHLRTTTTSIVALLKVEV